LLLAGANTFPDFRRRMFAATHALASSTLVTGIP
jgi:hypothetical protein